MTRNVISCQEDDTLDELMSSNAVQVGVANIDWNDLSHLMGTQVPARFAAFVNGIGIHADDYDDTQLAVAEDRVYGLLTHPTAPALSAALAMAEARRASR